MKITPHANLSPAAAALLTRLANLGSEGLYVANALNEIASNDTEQAADDYLCQCAKEIVDMAQEVIDTLQVAPAAKEIYALFQSKGVEEDALDDVVHGTASSAGSNANNGGPEEQISYLIRENGVEATRKIVEELS